MHFAFSFSEPLWMFFFFSSQTRRTDLMKTGLLNWSDDIFSLSQACMKHVCRWKDYHILFAVFSSLIFGIGLQRYMSIFLIPKYKLNYTPFLITSTCAINCYVCSFVEGTSKIFDSLAIKSVRERFFRFQDILVASSYLGLVSMGNVRHQLYQVLFRARVDDDWRDSKPTYSRPSPFVLDYSH